MVTPTVSIILPTFNRLPFLKEAIASVFAQTFNDWELIIADDGSDSLTHDYLKTLVNHSQVKLLLLQHTGNPAAVRNAGLRAASGEYVAFLDSDDVWLPTKLEQQIRSLRTCPDRRWSYTGYMLIDATGQELQSAVIQGWRPHRCGILEAIVRLQAMIALPSVVVTRSLLELTGGFDEEQFIYEDYDLWSRLACHSDVDLTPVKLVHIRKHEQHYSARDVLCSIEARQLFLEKLHRRLLDPRLRKLVAQECSKNVIALASLYASTGQRSDALRALHRCASLCWRFGSWWLGSVKTIIRMVISQHMLSKLRQWLSARRSRDSLPIEPRA